MSFPFRLFLALCIGCAPLLEALSLTPPLRRAAPRARSPLAVLQEEVTLISAAQSGEASRSALLRLFSLLEQASPSPKDILTTAAGKEMIDGRWKLISTIAARVGDDDDELSDNGLSMAVNASGIVLDVQNNARAPVQEVDVEAGRIGNEICFPIAGSNLIVRVAGSFDVDACDGRRALVNFDALDVFLVRGGADTQRLLRLGWLFTAVRKLKPALINGDESSTSWLDTTYLSPRVRLGRGNKGSVFVLQRAESEVAPLAQFALLSLIHI